MAGRDLAQPDSNGDHRSTSVFSFRRTSKNKKLKLELAATEQKLISILESTSRENGRLAEKNEEYSQKNSNLEKQLEILSNDVSQKNRKVQQLFSYSLAAYDNVDVEGNESKITILEKDREEDICYLPRLSTVIEKILQRNKTSLKTLHQLKEDLRREKEKTIDLFAQNTALQKEAETLVSSNKGHEEKVSTLQLMCSDLRTERDGHIETIKKLSLDLDNTKEELNESTIKQIEREAELRTENELLARELSNTTSANHFAMFQIEKLKRDKSRMFRAMNTQRQAHETKLKQAWLMFCKLKKEKEALPERIFITKTVPKYLTSAAETTDTSNVDSARHVAMRTRVLELEQTLFRRDKLIAELEDRVRVYDEGFSIFSDKYLSSFLDESFPYPCSSVSTVMSSHGTLSLSSFISGSSTEALLTSFYCDDDNLCGNNESRVSSQHFDEAGVLARVDSVLNMGSNSILSTVSGSQVGSSMSLS